MKINKFWQFFFSLLSRFHRFCMSSNFSSSTAITKCMVHDNFMLHHNNKKVKEKKRKIMCVRVDLAQYGHFYILWFSIKHPKNVKNLKCYFFLCSLFLFLPNYGHTKSDENEKVSIVIIPRLISDNFNGFNDTFYYFLFLYFSHKNEVFFCVPFHWRQWFSFSFFIGFIVIVIAEIFFFRLDAIHNNLTSRAKLSTREQTEKDIELLTLTALNLVAD